MISPTQRRQPVKRCSHLLWTSHPEQGPSSKSLIFLPFPITASNISLPSSSKPSSTNPQTLVQLPAAHAALPMGHEKPPARPRPNRGRHSYGTHTQLNGKPWAGWGRKTEFTHTDSVLLPPNSAPSLPQPSRKTPGIVVLANPTRKPRN